MWLGIRHPISHYASEGYVQIKMLSISTEWCWQIKTLSQVFKNCFQGVMQWTEVLHHHHLASVPRPLATSISVFCSCDVSSLISASSVIDSSSFHVWSEFYSWQQGPGIRTWGPKEDPRDLQKTVLHQISPASSQLKRLSDLILNRPSSRINIKADSSYSILIMWFQLSNFSSIYHQLSQSL